MLQHGAAVEVRDVAVQSGLARLRSNAQTRTMCVNAETAGERDVTGSVVSHVCI